MILYIFQTAFLDFIRFRRLFPWLLLAGFVLVIGLIWQSLTPESTPNESYIGVSGLLVFRILPLASAILTTGVVSQEVEQKTIVYQLTRTVPRATLLLGRYLASVLVVIIVSWFTAAVLALAIFRGEALGNSIFHADLVALGIGAFAYGALFLFVSLLFNRAMLICLLYSFVWETSVPNLSGSMSKLAIVTYVQAIADHKAKDNGLAILSGSLRAGEISPSHGYAVLIALTLGCLLASCYWFTKFEYVPREDAE